MELFCIASTIESPTQINIHVFLLIEPKKMSLNDEMIKKSVEYTEYSNFIWWRNDMRAKWFTAIDSAILILSRKKRQ